MFRTTSGYSPVPTDECLTPSNTNTEFTNWRKIYLNYAFMEDRNGIYPTSCTYGQDKEYNGVHNLMGYPKVVGAFDDAFIEIHKNARYLPNTTYQLSLPATSSGLTSYGDDETGFRPIPPHDTIVILGVDHIGSECTGVSGELYGASVAHFLGGYYTDAFYNYAAVGGIHDGLRYIKMQDFIEVEFDEYGNPVWNIEEDRKAKLISLYITHELGHCLLEKGNEAHTEHPHGVMRIDKDDDWNTTYFAWRSYFHAGHIMDLRMGLNKFDSNDY